MIHGVSYYKEIIKTTDLNVTPRRNKIWESLCHEMHLNHLQPLPRVACNPTDGSSTVLSATGKLYFVTSCYEEACTVTMLIEGPFSQMGSQLIFILNVSFNNILIRYLSVFVR